MTIARIRLYEICPGPWRESWNKNSLITSHAGAGMKIMVNDMRKKGRGGGSLG